MITLCIHCLRPIEKLTATILPPSPNDPTATPRDAKTFTVSVQKLHATFVQSTGKAELMLDVITDEPGITPDDVNAVDQFSCVNCGKILNPQIHCYTVRGREINPSPAANASDAEKDVPSGYVMVATMGANSRFDLRTQQEVKDAVQDLVEFDDSGERKSTDSNPQADFQWDS